MAKLVLIRHGNTFDKGDTVLRVGCRTDLPLSSSGREQADKLGAHLKAEGLLPQLVLTSELKRTQETANRALAAAYHTCPVQARAELNEIDYGPDEGKPETEVVARLGEEALRLWDECAIMPTEWSPKPDHIRATLNELMNELEHTPAAVIWIVTSNGIARFFAENIKDWAGTRPNHLKLSTAAYAVSATVPDAASPQWQMTAWNVKVP